VKTPSETQKLYARYTDLLQKHLAEVRDMGHREFPPGTKVRWVRTFARDGQGLYLSGVIQPVDKWARSAQVKSASGALHSVPWYSLEFDVEVTPSDLPIEAEKAA
jgi:hypothetical protein